MNNKQKIKALEEEVKGLRAKVDSRDITDFLIEQDMRKYGLSYEEAKALQESDPTARSVWYSAHIDGNV